MNKLKENKAITLIALIITIIVLLILAGVVINMTLGNDGIINKAQGAVDMYKNAQEKEEAMLNTIADKLNDRTITAEMVTYTHENWDVNNVKEALDYLYGN